MNRKLYFGGDIVTMEDKGAEAVVTEEGRILYAGSLDAAKALGGEEVDLEGAAMLPAFMDAHSHLSGCANALLQADLQGVSSFQELIFRIQEYIRKNRVPKGAFVLARGFEEHLCREKTHPDLWVLDRAAPENPLVVQYSSGHAGIFNTLALQELEIDPQTPVPEGGRREVKNGRLTGYMEENAFLEPLQRIPLPSLDALLDAYQKAQEMYASFGITTVQEGMLTWELAPIYQRLLEKKGLFLDVVAYGDAKKGLELAGIFAAHKGKYVDLFRFGGYKMFLDGSPQSRTAWMLTPYRQGGYGYPVLSDDAVLALVSQAKEDQMQILAHCNGDAAARQYIQACGKAGDVSKIRPVMIHGQLLQPEQVKLVKEAHILPSFFIGHVFYWGDVHIENFGLERASHISPAGSCLKEGVPFTFHQDAPVTPPNMLESVWCAVCRRTKNGTLLGEQERISVYDALRAVTVNAAWQYFEETEKGSIAPGKKADFVILDKNPLKVPVEGIRSIRVLQTIKEGRIVYQQAGLRQRA